MAQFAKELESIQADTEDPNIIAKTDNLVTSHLKIVEACHARVVYCVCARNAAPTVLFAMTSC